MANLHYIFDPLCGWCYGAAPLLQALRGIPDARVGLHGGGMFVGRSRQPVTPALRQYVKNHDQRIGQLTGQTFGDAYRDGLLTDTTAVLDSAPPTAAILAAEALQGQGLEMLEQLQIAHFQQGLKISEAGVLEAVAVTLGLERTAFANAYTLVLSEELPGHLRTTHEMMVQAGVGGFPALVIQHGTQTRQLPITDYYGQPDAWRDYVVERLK